MFRGCNFGYQLHKNDPKNENTRGHSIRNQMYREFRGTNFGYQHCTKRPKTHIDIEQLRFTRGDKLVSLCSHKRSSDRDPREAPLEINFWFNLEIPSHLLDFGSLSQIIVFLLFICPSKSVRRWGQRSPSQKSICMIIDGWHHCPILLKFLNEKWWKFSLFF